MCRNHSSLLFYHLSMKWSLSPFSFWSSSEGILPLSPLAHFQQLPVKDFSSTYKYYHHLVTTSRPNLKMQKEFKAKNANYLSIYICL